MTAFLLDMDGVLYRGECVIDGAVEFMAAIRACPHAFLTNNSAQPPSFFRERLRRLGLMVDEDAPLITSAMATAERLHQRSPGFRYYAVGGPGLHAALSARGEARTDTVDYVVVGEGAGLNHASLTLGGNLVLAGATLVATNPDASVDDAGRVLPGGGALVAPFEVMTGQRAMVIGKPEAALYRAGSAALGVEPEQAIMVGDRPDTDIAGAARLGMRSLLVRSGRFHAAARYPDDLPRPTWDVPDLRAALDHIKMGTGPDSPPG